jgi:hypothetical protein
VAYSGISISGHQTIERNLAIHTRDLSVNSLDILVRKHNCETLDQLITKRQTLEKLIEEREKSLSIIQKSKISLEQDVEAREQTIRVLEAKESQLPDKENFLRHARYLRGEIDGFISNYNVEGKDGKNNYANHQCISYSIHRWSLFH